MDNKKNAQQKKSGIKSFNLTGMVLIHIVIAFLEIAMLLGIFLVIRKSFVDIKINTFLVFLYTFFTWALIIIVTQLFRKSAFSIDNLGKHIPNFLTILLISLGLVTGISYLISNRPFVPIPNLKGGSFGFRTWNCYASVEDIVVSYRDSISGEWLSIDKELLHNADYWVRRGHEFEKYRSPTRLDNGPIPRIYIDQCGAFFNLRKAGYQADISSAKIEATITFYKANDDDSAYPNIEFSLRVPWDYEEHTPSSDLYIGLQTFFFHPEWSKCWIPALALAPSKLHNNSNSMIKKSTGFTKYEYKKPYRLRGVWYEEYVGLYLMNMKSGAAATLYEGRIGSNKDPIAERQVESLK